jgi:hypothetical protein
MYEPLRAQVKTSISNLNSGTIQRSDRIFMNHLLEQLEFVLESGELESGRQIDICDSFYDVLGSTNELVEDGLED